MNRSIIAFLVATCIITIATAANSTVSGTSGCTNTDTTKDSLGLNCKDLAASCYNYIASGTAASTIGRHCTTPKTGYFVYSDLAIQDATAGTDDVVCSTSCSASGASGTGSSVVPPCDAATGLACSQCASTYFPPAGKTPSSTSQVACTQCIAVNCSTCYGDAPSVCTSCPSQTYPSGNTTAGSTSGNGNSTSPFWTANGPTTCIGTVVPNCAIGLNGTACAVCTTGYSLSTSTLLCSSSFSQLVGASFAFVGAALYLLF